MTRLNLIYFYVAVGLLCISCVEKPIQHSSIDKSEEILKTKTAQKLQQALNPKDVLLKYEFQENSSHLKILGVEKNSVQTFEIKLPSDFDSTVDELYQLLQHFSLAKTKKRKAFISKSALLHQYLITPLQSFIASKDRLIILTEGKLQLIPFEILISKEENKPYSDLDYLIKEYDISYHFSESAFLASKKTQKKQPSFLGFAPIFESTALAARDFTESTGSYRNTAVQPLPYSRKEINGLKEKVSYIKKMSSQIATDEFAKEAWLKVELEKQHQIVHIASHSFADLDNPERSGILCAESEDEDAVLTIKEISKMTIQSDLVVLSSCESGIGKIEKSKKMNGIHRSFIEAGTANVLYSLWKVNDKVSSDMMIDFYEKFLSNSSNYPAALRKAKLKLIKNKSTACPNLWAPFVLMGR